LAEYIGQPWTADPQFATLEGRLANSEQLDQLLGEWTRQFEAYPLMEALQSLGVAAAPVLSIEEQFADPQYLARQVYTFLQHPSVGEEPVYGLPWRLGDTPGQVSRPAPNLGEHNEYVLGELLGYSTAVIRSLEASGVLS
jgi:crotonobetainyl-CoA:carnitine CoA-transferase CaiB-like acyl-CoA transferase